MTSLGDGLVEHLGHGVAPGTQETCPRLPTCDLFGRPSQGGFGPRVDLLVGLHLVVVPVHHKLSEVDEAWPQGRPGVPK